MQENRFEKDIRRQLEKLQFTPSAPVWESVAASIQEKKRKRRIIIFFMSALLGLAITAGTIYQLNQKTDHTLAVTNTDNSNSTSENNRSNSTLVSSQREDELNNSSASTGSPTVEKTNSVSNPELPSSVNTIAPEQKPVSEDKTNTTVNSVRTDKPSRSKTAAAASVEKLQKSVPAKRSASQAPQEASSVVNSDVVNDSYSDLNSTVISGNRSTAETDSAFTKTEITKEEVPALTAIDSLSENAIAQSAVIQKLAKRKISWSAEFSVGFGNRHEQLLKGMGRELSPVDIFMGSPMFGPPGPPTVQRNFPSSSKPMIGMSMGIIAKLPVSKRISINAGVRYHYQSEKLAVGTRLDSNVRFTNATSNLVLTNQFYNGPAQRSYLNQHHFIQMPISIEWQINRGKKTPIFWEVGAAPGFTMPGKSLVYDTAFNGIYYNDRTTINRFQLSALTAFSIQLGAKGPFKWTIGPELRFNLTPLGENKFDTRQYLLYGGIRARFTLPKKNK